MSRSVPARALVLALAAASLPGCVVALGSGNRSSVATPTGDVLSSLEKRMDRVDERLPKRVE